jgi:hypothetical protein
MATLAVCVVIPLVLLLIAFASRRRDPRHEFTLSLLGSVLCDDTEDDETDDFLHVGSL